LSEWKSLKVDFKNVITDFLTSYPYDSFEVLVIETVANSIDSGATTIQIGLRKTDNGLAYRVEDNGSGMTRKQFENNYHALALSSKTKGQGIGFAGIGAKLYLACLSSGQKIITETRQGEATLASELTLIRGEPKWRYVSGELADHGTVYTVVLDPSAALVNNGTVREMIWRHFNALLLEGKTTVLVEGEKMGPWIPKSEAKSNSTFRIRNDDYECTFWLGVKESDRAGIEVSVYGKRITAGDYFGVEYQVRGNFRKRIYGIVQANGLAPLLNTPKTDFRTQVNPQLWAAFRKQVYVRLREWLEEVGGLQQERQVSAQSELMAMELEISSVLDSIFSNPSLMKYNPFLRTRLSRTPIPSQTGAVQASLQQGAQRTEGDHRGSTEGLGVNTPGPEPGQSLHLDEEGDKPAREVQRKIRTGIQLNYRDEPENDKQSWYTPEAIVVNVGHNAFKKSERQGFFSEEQHVLRCVFFSLMEAFPPASVGDAIQDLNRFYTIWGSLS